MDSERKKELDELSNLIEKISKDMQSLLDHANKIFIESKSTLHIHRKVVVVPTTVPNFESYEAELEQIITDAGGNVFQSDLISATGLSKAKISITLSRLKEEGKIIKIRRGRENIIKLNGFKGKRVEAASP